MLHVRQLQLVVHVLGEQLNVVEGDLERRGGLVQIRVLGSTRSPGTQPRTCSQHQDSPECGMRACPVPKTGRIDFLHEDCTAIRVVS